VATIKKNTGIKTGLRGRPRRVNYSCPAVSDCTETFSSRAELGRHVRLTHTDLFRCARSGCNKFFSSDEALQLHNKRHAREFAFMCARCDSGFVSRKELNMHVKIHEKRTAAGQHTCSYCSRRFVSRHKLKLHMTVHTGRPEIR
jgi:uncharacterized Zn-finger protein